MICLPFKLHFNELIHAEEIKLDYTPDCARSPEIRFSQLSMSTEEADFCLLARDLVCRHIMFFIIQSTLLK